MKKLWKNIEVGDVLKDGSIVTQIHKTHSELACKVIYDTDKEFICAYSHVLLVDVHELTKAGKIELDKFCTFVPLEENLEIESESELTSEEKVIIDRFCHNESITVDVDVILDNSDVEIYDFHFDSIKRVKVRNVILKSEPQKVDENTYWLNCKGIDYLMKTYKCNLYCNGNLINKIEILGEKPCFCISTNTGKYET